jgi:hypothetical protein
MIVDVQTARAAGVRVWIVSPDGPGAFPPAGGAAPDRVLGSFVELPGLIAQTGE